MVRFLAQFQNGAKLGSPKGPLSGWTYCMLRIVCFCLVFIVTLATGQTAWAQQGSQENTGPLPPPPPNAAPFVESAPVVAFKRIEDQNGSVRIAFKGIGPGGAKIEVRDVIVAPMRQSGLTRSKGRLSSTRGRVRGWPRRVTFRRHSIRPTWLPLPPMGKLKCKTRVTCRSS